ncbi:FkbM family methyltransferase [bacterium]|nr:FkbM family methyltransferase [bacterium]
MKQHFGLYFPEYDTHFPRMLEKSLNKDNVLRYQWRQRDHAINICHNKRICIDIGANVGLWSCDLVYKFEQVIAFEPVEEFRECFRRNVKKNNYIIHPVALGKTESFINMNITEGNTGHSHVDLSSLGQGNIPLRTLDSFNLLNVDLIKIDVEGYEEEILLGAMNTIKINKPVLVVEQQHHEYKNDMINKPAIKILESWGYMVQAQYNKDWILQCQI